jgi:hypothetical protein
MSANSGITDMNAPYAIPQKNGRERYLGSVTVDMETVAVVSDISTSAEEQGSLMLIREG